ncbi:MAG TPA: hypothetical protein VIL20_13250 [Sandaracinaceae bacterium]
MIWLISHAMCALYPRTDALPGIADTDVIAFLRRYRRESTALMWLGLVLGTWVFVCTPILTVYLPLPSFLLPRGLLDRHAHRITGTRFYYLRQAVFLVKLAAGLCWGSHPAVRAKLALAPYPPDPGTWIEGEPKRRLPVAREEARP